MTDTPDWVAVGAKVAEYYTGRYNRSSVKFSSVAKLTATQIVLENGNRYRRSNLTQLGEDRDSWSGSTELRRADDGRVRAAIADAAMRNLIRKIELMGGRMDVAKALETLDRIDELVSTARARITASVPAEEESKDA
jgi:hypothetical protein